MLLKWKIAHKKNVEDIGKVIISRYIGKVIIKLYYILYIYLRNDKFSLP